MDAFLEAVCMADISIPESLLKNLCNTKDGSDWLARLPGAILDLRQRWALTLGPPVAEEASCSWVAPCQRHDGTTAILKLGMPHMEAQHELDGLLFWAGDPAVFVFEADVELNAMLLERCVPGTTLRGLPEPEQDVVIAGLLRRLWRTPSQPHPFRPLSEMIAAWIQESLEMADRWPDRGLAQAGLQVFEELINTAPSEVLLATDLHAGNVLRAQRAPWLVIDPKPFLGDPAYDATQHLLNCQERLRANPIGTIRRFADLLGVDLERVRLWTFARLATGTSDDMQESQLLAKMLMV
jgi:streptomycin 6-kinase